MTTAPRLHERHRRNRDDMAHRLASHIRSTGDEVLNDPDLLAWLPKHRLDALARNAGERHIPAWGTWRVVLDLLRRPAPVPCTADPFKGLDR